MIYVKYVSSIKGLEAAQTLIRYTHDAVAKVYTLNTFTSYSNAQIKTYLCIKCHKTDCWPEIQTG